MIPAKYRKALYWAAAILTVAVIALGVATPEELNAGVDIASRVVAVIAALLAAFNVTPEP